MSNILSNALVLKGGDLELRLLYRLSGLWAAPGIMLLEILVVQFMLQDHLLIYSMIAQA